MNLLWHENIYLQWNYGVKTRRHQDHIFPSCRPVHPFLLRPSRFSVMRRHHAHPSGRVCIGTQEQIVHGNGESGHECPATLRQPVFFSFSLPSPLPFQTVFYSLTPFPHFFSSSFVVVADKGRKPSLLRSSLVSLAEFETNSSRA